MTIAMRSKEKYNGRIGVITKVLSQKVRVKLLDGPAAGEEKDYTRASLKETVTTEEEQDQASPDGCLGYGWFGANQMVVQSRI